PWRLAPGSAQTRHSAGSRLSGPAPHCHRRARWLRLAGHDLPEPLRHCPRPHPHGLEWSPVLPPRPRKRHPCAPQSKSKCVGRPQWLATCARNEHRIFAPANTLACINLKPQELVMRPYWKGYLKLALVSCPIALHAACSSAERIAFRQINKATGNRLRQQLIHEETREPLAPEHKGRGYEVAKGQYLIVEDAELEAIEIESTHTIEIDSFVRRSAIDQRFFDSPYYVMPSAPVGQEAFAVICEAMRDKGMVALGRLVLSKRERVIALEPYDKGLLGTTLRYPYEVRKAEDYFCDLPDVTIASDMLTLAEHILDSKASEFAPATFRDRYEEALVAHLKAKQAGGVPERRKIFAPPHRVVNLMEALRRSVAEDTKGAAPRKG